MSTGFIHLATIKTKPGHAATIKAHLEKVREDVKANEPGTKQYQVTQDGKDENVFVVWEEYTGEEAVDAHRAGEAYKALRKDGEDKIESLIIQRLFTF